MRVTAQSELLNASASKLLDDHGPIRVSMTGFQKGLQGYLDELAASPVVEVNRMI
jgi:hypothetical protein